MPAPRLVLRSAVLTLAALAALRGDSKKSVEDQRIELLRGLTAEWATVKTYLPRSKKPLDFDSSGAWDQQKWQDIGKELGPVGRTGDLIQVTHVGIEKDAIVLELNHGVKSGGHWYDHVQVGLGGATNPIGNPGTNVAANGTTIAVRFAKGIGDVTSADVKKMLKPVLEFDKTTVTEQYIDTLPPEVKQAVQEKKAIAGMDRDMVLLALGRPLRKSREAKDGEELEDWIYGEPPGRMTFVTFSGAKVVRVKETYAGLGGSIAETPAQP
jgi:hypothetical protein